MNRVFLSYSRKDENYVDIVARHLRRSKIIFDKINFDLGKNFIDEMERGLKSSNLFVFFASKNSLQSVWCKYEIDQAKLLQIKGKLELCLTIIIDRHITFNDLPEWMRNSKVVIQTRPSQSTRDIKNVLFSIQDPELRKPFIGRQRLQEKFIEQLSDVGSQNKKIFILSGLEGIGRRAYLKRTSKDIIGLQLQPFFLLNETRGLEDLYLWTLNETEDLGTRNNLANEIKIFSSLSAEQKILEIQSRLHILCEDGCLPCLVDEGGILGKDGRYKEEYISLLKNFILSENDHYLAIIHRRNPDFTNFPFMENICYQRITSLDHKETGLLVQHLFRKNQLKLTPDQRAELVNYLDGYPPAAYFSCFCAAEYGIENLIADKSLLVDFKIKRFTKFLSELNFNKNELFVLKYLVLEQYVPLAVLGVVCDISLEEVSKTLRSLINKSLVVVRDDKYGISPPIRDAIIRAKGFHSKEIYTAICKNLTDAFWKDTDTAPTVEIVDATLNSMARSGSANFAPYQDLVRVSTVHSLAKECYHKKDWQLSLEYAKRAEQMDKNRPDVREIHFKSLVQLEQWNKSQKKLDEIYQKGDFNRFYLKGFMLRKMHKHDEAIEAFQAALDSGNHSYPVYRDYADCLYRCSRYSEAFEKIKWVLERDSENIFVLDLVIRICIDSGDLDGAETFLSELERFDLDKKFIHHRKARFYSAKRMWNLALSEAESACNSAYSPFEAYAQKVDILIELQNFDLALEEITNLKSKFFTHRKDIQLGLRCKLLIRQNKWEEAKLVWDSINEKTTIHYQALLQKILELKSRDKNISLTDRESARLEAEEIKRAVEFENEETFVIPQDSAKEKNIRN